MSSNLLITIGVICGAISLFALPYGFYLKSKEEPTVMGYVEGDKINVEGDYVKGNKVVNQELVNTEKLEAGQQKILDSLDHMEKSLPEKIRAYNKRLIEKVDLSDPRLKDGGKIGVSLVLHTIDTVGGLIDFGDRLDPKKNGIFLSIKRKKLILKLYDMNGEKYVLEGTFEPKINKKGRIECVWSSKQEFVALIYDGEIIAKMQFPRLSILIDFSKIQILRLAVGLDAPIHVRNIEIYAEKELAKK